MGGSSLVKWHNSIDNRRSNRSVRSSGQRPFHIGKIATGASDYSLPSEVEIFQIDRDFSAGMSTCRDKASLRGEAVHRSLRVLVREAAVALQRGEVAEEDVGHDGGPAQPGERHGALFTNVSD